MGTNVKRTQKDYTLAFKLSVVDQVEKGQMSYKQAQKVYGIQGRSTVLVWCRKHGNQDWSPRTRSRKRRCSLIKQDPKSLSPEQRIIQLEVALKNERLRADLFEAVVTVIEKEYGLSVPKKLSGKCWNKSKSKA
jgi:transposase